VDVVAFLVRDQGFARARSKYASELLLEDWLTEPNRMLPVAAAADWQIPAIDSVKKLADWLHLDISELEWFADLKGLGSRRCDIRLQHYHYRVLEKKSDSIRLIEAPKSRLKELQRQIQNQILRKIPSHPAVHGFVKGRSIRTFVAPHVGRHLVLRLDLQDFFPSLPAARIRALFRTAGYPEPIADLLGGLCTNAAPGDLWAQLTSDISGDVRREMRSLYGRPHLPQGAPTSPTLANLCAYRMDCRLTGLAHAVNADYTRYADDLAFSGDRAFERCVERFATHAAAIVIEEGFAVHHRKTRLMRQGVRQHLAGLVTNRRINVARTDFDRLKAILHNCIRHGPESQNRDHHAAFRSHLEGRVGFVEAINPIKGKRLREIFERIEWR
jgi:retron-type reverse transcriptase